MSAIHHDDGFWYDYSAPIDREKQEENVDFIVRYFRAREFTDNAIAAMVGNFQAESAINPARWEGDTDWRAQGTNRKGFGLAQWTPWAKYTTWCADKGYPEYHLETACYRIWCEFCDLSQLGGDYGTGQYYSTDEFPVSRSEFISSTMSPQELAKVFVRNYERPGSVLYDPDEETYEEHLAAKEKTYRKRAELAADWYEYITGVAPDPGDPDAPGGGRSRVLDIILWKRRRLRVV